MASTTSLVPRVSGWRPTLYRAPRANAVCEGWIEFARPEALDWLLIAGECHVGQVLSEAFEGVVADAGKNGNGNVPRLVVAPQGLKEERSALRAHPF
jgi:hypothetical protein